MKKGVCVLLYLTLPAILNVIASYLDNGLWFVIAVCFTYLATVVGFVLYYKYTPCSYWAVLIGILLAPALVVVCETISSSMYFTYLYSLLSVLFYVFPSAIISFIFYCFTLKKTAK